MLCYRCGSHVPDGTEACGTCGQKFALGLKPGPIAGFGTGTRRHRIAVESSPYKVGDLIAGRFEIKDNVGAGPIGWVYKCLDREIDVDVSLKVISPRFLQQPEERKVLLRELRLARKLSHANIVRVYEDGEDQDRVFFTMQHLEGLTLRRIWDLRRQKGQLFALREVEPIIAQMAQALDYAHDTFTHGDLKPDNVIVLPDLLKITDFGLATALPRAPFMAAQKTGGVHRYLAPEFLHGERLSPRIDVFSLGVILGEMLAGAPFEGQGFDLLARNNTLPREVDLVFRKAVSFKPEERFATASEFALALGEAANPGERRPSRQPTPPPPVRATQSQVPVVPAPAPTPAPVVSTPAMAPPPEAPIATPASANKVAPPKHAGSGIVREVTEEIGDEQIEELLEQKPELRLPKRERAPEPPRQGPSVVAVDTQPPTPKAAKKDEKKPSAEMAALQQAPTPKSTPKVEKPAEKPAPKDQKQKPAEPKGDPRKDAPKSSGKAPVVPAKESKSEPAWSSSGASVPPPKELPKAPAAVPAQPPANRTPVFIAAALVCTIIAVFVYIGLTEKEPVRKAEPALVAQQEQPTTQAEQPADPVAAQPAVEAAKEPAKAEPKPDPKTVKADEKKPADKAESKVDAKADAKLAEAKAAEERKKAEDEATARKAQREEALKRLAEIERAAAERAAAEKAAAEKAAAEKALAEKAAAEKAAAEKAIAAKATSEAAVTTASIGGTCPGGMRLIPAGDFKFGAPDSDDLKNFGEIDLAVAKTGAYCIDIYESPNNAKVKPTAGVTWKQAADSCRAQKKRLCREEEWERACKGPGGSARFPYGRAFDPGACNTEDGDGNPRDLTFPGSFSKCVSGFGIYDMAGNVAEWVDAVFEEGAGEKVLKGGAADRPDFATRCAARGKKSPAAKDKLLGFRCCADPK